MSYMYLKIGLVLFIAHIRYLFLCLELLTKEEEKGETDLFSSDFSNFFVFCSEIFLEVKKWQYAK